MSVSESFVLGEVVSVRENKIKSNALREPPDFLARTYAGCSGLSRGSQQRRVCPTKEDRLLRLPEELFFFGTAMSAGGVSDRP